MFVEQSGRFDNKRWPALPGDIATANVLAAPVWRKTPTG